MLLYHTNLVSSLCTNTIIYIMCFMVEFSFNVSLFLRLSSRFEYWKCFLHGPAITDLNQLNLNQHARKES